MLSTELRRIFATLASVMNDTAARGVPDFDSTGENILKVKTIV